MYLCKKRLLPESFNDMFLLRRDVHKYNTRTKNSFRLPLWAGLFERRLTLT